jgi:hypothetical protein
VRHGFGVLALTFGWAAVVLLGSMALGSSLASGLEVLERSARAMLPIIGVYATVVLVALAMWATADADFRTLASVIVLGPFTLVRPWVIVAAAVAGGWAAHSLEGALVVLGACGLQLGLEPWLGLGWRGGRRPLG